MATDVPNRGLEATTRELLETLREIDAAVDAPRPQRLVKPPTPRGLLEFTSEVGIPAAILVLRTNIAALELLQRSLRMMAERDDRDAGSSKHVRDRAESVTAASLSRLDDALADLRTTIDDGGTDRTPSDLLAEAREQTERLEAQLSSMEDDGFGRRDGPGTTEVNVDAELESLRQSVDDGGDGDEDTPDSSDGD